MSIPAKRNLSGIICAASAFIMTACIGGMVPNGLAGEVGKVKLYFAGMMLAFVCSIVAGLAYHQYRHRADDGAERMRAEAGILSQVGQKPASAPPKTPGQSQPDDPRRSGFDDNRQEHLG